MKLFKGIFSMVMTAIAVAGAVYLVLTKAEMILDRLDYLRDRIVGLVSDFAGHFFSEEDFCCCCEDDCDCEAECDCECSCGETEAEAETAEEAESAAEEAADDSAC